MQGPREKYKEYVCHYNVWDYRITGGNCGIIKFVMVISKTEKEYTYGNVESFYNVLLDTLSPNIGKHTHVSCPYPREFIES